MNRPRRSLVLAAIVGVVVVTAAVISLIPGPAPTGPAPVSAPALPAVRGSIAGSESTGSQACAACHRERAEGYAGSSHGRALAEIDVEREPPDGVFDHEASGRRYRVYRKDDQLWHRESIVTPDDGELVLSDHPLAYVVGSGHQGRTYIVRVDDFLVQSPVTWYTSRNRWNLAPGYDRAEHYSFERPIPTDCLICHAGRTESIDGSYHRLRVHEAMIACERCHGPGDAHVARHENSDLVEENRPDPTIVHPGRLSRELAEAICAQCHIQNNAASNIRGRELADYRPGLNLNDFVAYFVPEAGETSMTVVGHIEQLHRSRCYQQTDSLTCTTCHNPHREISKAERVEYYRGTCLACHQPDSCGLPAGDQRRHEVSDACATCHMPQTTTEIPHVASTHHRIGVHEDAGGSSPSAAAVPARLIPLHDLSHLDPLDIDRCRGLANRQLASKQSDPRAVAALRERARKILDRVHRLGLRDGELLAALADLEQDRDRERAMQLARQALAHRERLDPRDRVNSLAVLAGGLVQQDRPQEAVGPLEQLVQVHRDGGAWMQLGFCRKRLGDPDGMLAAYRQFVAIRPHDPNGHRLLSEACRRQGRLDEATRHARRSRLLSDARRRQAGSIR